MLDDNMLVLTTFEVLATAVTISGSKCELFKSFEHPGGLLSLFPIFESKFSCVTISGSKFELSKSFEHPGGLFSLFPIFESVFSCRFFDVITSFCVVLEDVVEPLLSLASFDFLFFKILAFTFVGVTFSCLSVFSIIQKM